MLDVIVIGAGAAGLTASRDLAEAGRRVVLFEARERIGGRMFSIHPPELPIAVELGAEFVHGNPPEISTADKYQLFGRHLCAEERGLIECGFEDHVDQIMTRMHSYDGPDLSFANFLNTQAGDSAPRARETAKEYVEGFNAADATRIGVRGLQIMDAAAEEDGDDELLRLRGGYDRFALQLLSNKIDEVRLGEPVREIRWSRGSVEVNGMRARKAVTTIPLALLQNDRVRFTPQLPQKSNAARRVAVGPVVRITFRFYERFWETVAPDVSMIHSQGADFPTWWSVRPDESPILTAWAAGPRAARLSNNSTTQNIDLALASLTKMLHVNARQYVADAYTHDWQKDEFSLGAYSYLPAGALDAPVLLAEPVEDTLFFAGEATETTGRGATVHGAIATGRRAAKQILSTQ